VTSPPIRPVDDGRLSAGTIIAAIVLILIMAGAIWYFNASGGGDDFPNVTVTAPSGDPGTETTIVR